MSGNCPNAPKCPIFNGILSDKVMTAKSYRGLYCEANQSKWSSCKRYMSKERYGSCPPDLLPNSAMSLEKIGEKYGFI